MQVSKSTKNIVLGITGSSGSPLVLAFLELLSKTTDCKLSLIVSPAANTVFKEESHISNLGSTPSEIHGGILSEYFPKDRMRVYASDDMAAAVSSGSHLHDGMVILPCSMSTLSAIANGITMNLIHRAASVTLKQGWPLVIVPRESPLSAVHLRNMLELTNAGAIILPATVSYYHHPKSDADMNQFIALRVMDALKIENFSDKRWKGTE